MSGDGTAVQTFALTRTAAQVAALRALAAQWQASAAAEAGARLPAAAESFWAFDDVLAALGRPGSVAFFAAPAASSLSWDGVIFADVGPFTADLLYVYVRGSARRHGVGRALVERLVAALAARRGTEALFLEVRASNGPAQELYRQLGFAPVGQRRRYYADGEDAVVMRYAFGC